VGFVSLPVSTSPNTAPGSRYTVGLSLEIKRLGKKPQRVREPQGGGAFIVQELNAQTCGHIEALRGLRFSFEAGGRKQFIQAPFEILPRALSSLKEVKADWVSLWTLRDYMDDYTAAHKIWPQAQSVKQQLTRDLIFMPLLKMTQTKFQACGYPLHPPEAIFITKLLTLMVEMGITEPSALEPRPVWPRWFGKLCRLLVQEPALASQPEPLITRLLFSDVAYDAMAYAFTMINTVAGESFGSTEETNRYAEGIIDALVQQKQLDFAGAYFPLVLGGVIANQRVTMPKEQVRETVFILSKALDARRPEKNEDNAFVFDLADRLIERALDTT
jgi:hypothetical protein